MRSFTYPELIKEDLEELLKLERAEKEGRYRDRVRFIRHLKEGSAFSQEQAGSLVGLKRNQSQKLWKLYVEAGIQAMTRNNYKGSWGKLDSLQQSRLLKRLDSDDVITHKQIIN